MCRLGPIGRICADKTDGIPGRQWAVPAYEPLGWGAKTSLQQSNSAVSQAWVSTRRPMRRRRPQPGVIVHLPVSAWNVTKAGCQEVPWHPRQIPACSGEGAETECSDLLQQNRAR